MAVDSRVIKEKAHEYGTAVCGIASIARFKDEQPVQNPVSVCPKAKSVIGFVFYVSIGFYAPRILYSKTFKFCQSDNPDFRF